MYTGIIEDSGRVSRVSPEESGVRIVVKCPTDGLRPDDSISVSGVCVTAEQVGNGWFEGYLSAETVARTYLGSLAAGDEVHIERPLSLSGRFDGHVVKGTVDALSEVRGIDDHGTGDDWTFTFTVPAGYEQYVVEKGAVALDGVSLTVSAVDGRQFEVAVIPATYELTTLSSKQVGDPVHFEADILAKYVEKQRQVTA